MFNFNRDDQSNALNVIEEKNILINNKYKP